MDIPNQGGINVRGKRKRRGASHDDNVSDSSGPSKNTVGENDETSRELIKKEKLEEEIDFSTVSYDSVALASEVKMEEDVDLSTIAEETIALSFAEEAEAFTGPGRTLRAAAAFSDEEIWSSSEESCTEGVKIETGSHTLDTQSLQNAAEHTSGSPSVENVPIEWQLDTPLLTRPQFSPTTPSPALLISSEGPSERDFFNLMFTEKFFELVIGETEVFAQELLRRNLAPCGRITNWKKLTREDFEKWLGLLFHMGHVQIPRMENYWKRNHMYNIEFFGQVMGRDRFFTIMRALHFSRNPYGEDFLPTDRIFKIRPLIDFFNSTMREIYTPDKILLLDEPMVLWRGRLVFNQFVKEKKLKCGVKLYILTEPNGLVLRLFASEGNGGQQQRENVVKELMTDFLGKGHSLYSDKWYNSPRLTRYLLENKTMNTGILHEDRKDVPLWLVEAKPSKGEISPHWTEDGICAFKWRGRKEVVMISSEFGPEMVEIPKKARKPLALVEYNDLMLGTSRLDQLQYYFNCDHKSQNWYKKIGTHIFQIMIANCQLLNAMFSSDPKTDLWLFRHTIVDGLTGGPPEVVRPTKVHNGPVYHLPKFTEKAEDGKRRKQKRCKLCYEKGIRRDVIYVCEGCSGEAGFCLEPCFKDYHRRENLII